MSETAQGTAKSAEQLTPAEIDARHARHLLERSLEQLERGDRQAAILLCRQALHLAPQTCYAHSLSGLLQLLSGDIEAATESYKKAVQCSDGTTSAAELERYKVLRRAQAKHAPLDMGGLQANSPREIGRLRQQIAEAPLQMFMVKTAAPETQNGNANAGAQAIEAADRGVDLRDAEALIKEKADFNRRLQQRRRTSLALTIVVAAFAAGILTYAVRSWRESNATDIGIPSNSTEVVVGAGSGNQVATAPATNQPAAQTPTNATANTATTGNTTAPAAQPTAPTAPAQPVPTPTPSVPAVLPQPAPVARPVTPTRTPATTSRPSTPRPASRPAPAPTPRPVAPRPAPTPFVEPPLPAPRITLPSAGQPAPEFPRVQPDRGG